MMKLQQICTLHSSYNTCHSKSSYLTMKRINVHQLSKVTATPLLEKIQQEDKKCLGTAGDNHTQGAISTINYSITTYCFEEMYAVESTLLALIILSYLLALHKHILYFQVPQISGYNIYEVNLFQSKRVAQKLLDQCRYKFISFTSTMGFYLNQQLLFLSVRITQVPQ